MAEQAESLASLYQQTVLEHSREPHNLRRLSQADRQATGDNPLCGDRITVYLQETAGVVTDAAFEGCGCTISLASASMLTDLVRGKAIAEIRRLAQGVLNAFSSGNDPLPGDLAALGGVRAYPARIRCATLAWRTLDTALENAPAPASTKQGN